MRSTVKEFRTLAQIAEVLRQQECDNARNSERRRCLRQKLCFLLKTMKRPQ